jgi:PTS system nitrogen regulatory IIA component
MNLTQFISPETVISELKAKDKVSVLTELVRPLVDRDPGLDKDQLVKILLEREKLGSTGIGDGIAIPHGKVEKLDQLLISFGRSLDGIDFDSMDGKPAHLFFLLLAPESSTSSHLTALAQLSRLLKNQAFREDLLKAREPGALFRLIAEAGDED